MASNVSSWRRNLVRQAAVLVGLLLIALSAFTVTDWILRSRDEAAERQREQIAELAAASERRSLGQRRDAALDRLENYIERLRRARVSDATTLREAAESADLVPAQSAVVIDGVQKGRDGEALVSGFFIPPARSVPARVLAFSGGKLSAVIEGTEKRPEAARALKRLDLVDESISFVSRRVAANCGESLVFAQVSADGTYATAVGNMKIKGC